MSGRVARAGKAVPGLLRDLEASGVELESIEVIRPTLDDVFLTLTGRSLRDAEAGPESSGEDQASLRRLGRSLGYLKHPEADLEKTWRHHRREARRLHEKLFYRPLLAAVAGIPGDEARLTTGAAKERLGALGYADPEAALRHLEALTSGVSRTSAIQHTLLPALLAWFADAPDPDAGLFGFRRISDALGSTPWYLTMLRDEGETAQRLAQILATSRYATDLLERDPEGRQDPRRETPCGRLARGDPGEMFANAARRDPRRRSAASGRSAAASCSGSAPPTCSSPSGSPRSGTP